MTIRKPLLAGGGLAVAGALLLAGCAGTPSTSGEGGGDAVRIALVRQLSSGDYFEQWLAGAQAEAEELGVELQVLEANGDDAQQATYLESAVTQGFDAIAISHGFTETVQPGVADALSAGIPVVTFDVDSGEDGAIVVEQSDAELATLVTDQLVEDSAGEAQVIYAYVAGYAPLDRRDAVWQDVLEENAGIEQVAQVGSVSDNTAAETAAQVSAALQANPGTTAIFAPYDEFAKGAVLALQELGLEDQVKVYGADISTADIEVITAEGSPWVATAATDPSNVGAVTIRAAYLAATDGDVESPLVVAPALITQSALLEAGVTSIQELTAAFPELETPDVAPVGSD